MRFGVFLLSIVLVIPLAVGCASTRDRTPHFDRALQLGALGRIEDARTELLASTEEGEFGDDEVTIDILVRFADAALDSTHSMAAAARVFSGYAAAVTEDPCGGIALMDSVFHKEPSASLALLLAMAYSSYSLQFPRDWHLDLSDNVMCLGQTRGSIQRRDLAVRSIRLAATALRRDPDSDIAHYLLSSVYYTIGEYDKAYQECREARDAGRPCSQRMLDKIIHARYESTR